MYVCVWVCAYSCVVKCACVCMHIPVCENAYMHAIVCMQRPEDSIRYQVAPCTFLRQGLCCSQTSLPVGVHDVPVLGSLLFTDAHRLCQGVSMMPRSWGPCCSLMHTGYVRGCPGCPCPCPFISLRKTEITGTGYHT